MFCHYTLVCKSTHWFWLYLSYYTFACQITHFLDRNYTCLSQELNRSALAPDTHQSPTTGLEDGLYITLAPLASLGLL